MSKARRIPAYVHHKPSGQARVRIDGRDCYLGKYGSPESHQAYDDAIAEWLADSASPSTSTKATTFNAVLAAWWTECKLRYAGRGKGKYGNAIGWRPTIRMLREHCGNEHPTALGPKRLKTLLEETAKSKDWSLRYSRDVLSRVKAIFEWGVSEEMIDYKIYETLKTVKLRHGRHTVPLPP